MLDTDTTVSAFGVPLGDFDRALHMDGATANAAEVSIALMVTASFLNAFGLHLRPRSADADIGVGSVPHR
jgi:hypothetical protein